MGFGHCTLTAPPASQTSSSPPQGPPSPPHPAAGTCRFEDVAALLSFLARTYRDASAASIKTAPEDEVPLQLPGAAAFSAAAAHHLASC